MGAAFALSLLASAFAAVDLDLAIQAEGRSLTLARRGEAAQTRASASTSPSATARVDGELTHASAWYAPRLWSSDLAVHASPLVNHVLGARLELRPSARWSVAASASGMRGERDPLADPLRTRTTGASQFTSATALPYEAAGATLRTDWAIDALTGLTATGSFNGSRGTTTEARALAPLQHREDLALTISRAVSPRETLELAAGGTTSSTRTPAGVTVGTAASASGTLRHRLRPAAAVWIGGGGAYTRTEEPGTSSLDRLLPIGEAGLALQIGPRLTAEAALRVAPYVDRFNGVVSPAVDGRATLSAAVTESVTWTASVSGLQRTDGMSSVASGDVRAIWSRGRRLSVEIGALAVWQRERRPELPSFAEATALLGFGYRWSADDGERARAGAAP